MAFSRSGRLGWLTQWSASFTIFAMLGILIVLPILTLVASSFTTALPFSGQQYRFTLDNYVALWSPGMGTAVTNTLIVSVGGTVMAMVIGCGLAWLAARTDVPFKPLVHLAGIMPLFLSLVVASVTWTFLGSGRSGYLNIILDSAGLPFRINTQSLAGITFVHGLYYVPYPFLFVYGALNLIHPELEQAAAVHGGNLPRTLNRVTFPLVKPATIGSALLIFVLMIEEFPVPAIMGGSVGIETLSIRIFNLMTSIPSEPNQAAAVSMLLTAIVFALVYTQRRSLHGRDYRTVTGKGVKARLVPLRHLKWPAVSFVVLYALVALGLPVMALLLGSLRSSLFIPDAAALFDPQQMSLSHLVEAITDDEVQQGFVNSVLAGVSTAFFGGALYFVVAYAVIRTDLPGRRYMEYLAMAPLAVPALVMGLGILWTWLALPIPIYGTIAIFVVAFTARFMPQGYRSISSTMTQIHDELEEAAMVAGANRLQAVQRITLPLLRGTVVASAFLLLVLSMRELTASLFLYTTSTRVLSIVILEAYEQGAWTSVASLSLIYTAILVTLTLVGRRWMNVRL